MKEPCPMSPLTAYGQISWDFQTGPSIIENQSLSYIENKSNPNGENVLHVRCSYSVTMVTTL